MKRLFPLNRSAVNPFFLASLTLSYLCLPIFAYVFTYLVCGFFPSVSEYVRRVCSGAAFLLLSIYSITGAVLMNIDYFKKKRNKQ